MDVLDDAFKKLTIIAEGQSKTLNTINQTLALVQQVQQQQCLRADGIEADVKLLTETKNTMKGGWVALCVVGTAMVGLAGIVGALAAVLAIKFQ